jgi:2-succinyl-5-enolpyruvyl-6-hydroxy-3-cyclohexene-1-carboxylate synthase
MSQPNPSTAQARAIADELARHGVLRAMISPGSRSAALAIALEESPIAVDVVVDERSAAFRALGISRATGAPVACVSTSGTAGANFFPAVVEADLSSVPLIILTADRPPELRDVGSNQTIDQVGMFGAKVRWFCDLGIATSDFDGNGYWRSAVSQAVARAMGHGRSPGPVHLNVSFREPTVPVTDDGRVQGAAYRYPIDGREGGTPWQESLVAARRGAVLPDSEGRRGLLVVGEDWGDDAAGLMEEARRLGWPVLATALSGLRGEEVVTTYHHLLVDGVPLGLAPDLVVAAGRIGPSDRLAALTALDVPRIQVDRWGRWHDPRRHSTALVGGDLVATLGLIGQGCGEEWSTLWMARDARMREALRDSVDADGILTGPAVASAASSMPWQALTAASSMPVRDIDAHTVGPGRVFANRGASGIDGFTSTAIGVASCFDRTMAVSGDLSFLHDLSGLLGFGDVNLVLVIVDNNGGGLFDLLPPAEHSPSFERLFVAPHGRDLTAIGASLGFEATRVGSLDHLEESAWRGLEEGGAHVVIAPVERGAELKQRAGLDEVARLVS